MPDGQGNGHKAERGEVLGTAVEVEHLGQTIVEIVAVHFFFATHMEKYGQARLLDQCPEGIKVHMAGGMTRGAARGNNQALAAHVDGFARDI